MSLKRLSAFLAIFVLSTGLVLAATMGSGREDEPPTCDDGACREECFQNCEDPLLRTGYVVLPVIIKKVEPSYPDIARLARIEGKVILQAVINKEGNVNEVTVLRSSNPMFNDSAIDAVKQWKYKPAFQNGRPVAI